MSSPIKKFFSISDMKGHTGNLEKTQIKLWEVAGKPHCSKCGLDRTCSCPEMPYSGEGKKGILVFGEAPGKTEDTKGRQFVGMSGDVLYKKLRQYNINLYRDCYLFNAVNCRPPGNRKPTRQEMSCCRSYVLKVISELRPKHIFAFGGVAVNSLFMGRMDNKSIGTWVGRQIPDMELDSWIHPMYHPAYLLKNEKNKHLQVYFDRVLKENVAFLGTPFPERLEYKGKIHDLWQFEEVVENLVKLLHDADEKRVRIFFDYECNSLKPYWNGSRIETIGYCYNGEAYSFPFGRTGYWSKRNFLAIFDLWKSVLENKRIIKSAHNFKFEENWSRVIVSDNLNGRGVCTMLQAHVLDETEGTKSLDFQVFQNFGEYGYSVPLKPFLQSNKKEKFNRIDEAPLQKLLEYNALDCFYGYYLERLQEDKFGKDRDLDRARRLQLEGGWAFSDAELAGVVVSDEIYSKNYAILTDKIDKLRDKLLAAEEAVHFEAVMGRRMNLNSNDDLGHLLYNLYGYEPPKQTVGGGNSVDVESLREINIDFTNLLLVLRKYQKIRDTYLEQFIRESSGNIIHPVISLHIARTYRSSMQNPNMQNIPIRERTARRYCRKGIQPRPGHRLVEDDYSAVEIRIIACYSEDPKLVYEIKGGYDMHGEQARHSYLLDDETYTKSLRGWAKNKFVFPEFYGSYFVNCARDLWEVAQKEFVATGQPLLEHLADKGLDDYNKFEAHIKGVENRLWEKYKYVKQWQQNLIKSYLEKGFISLFTGHKRRGLMTVNELINAPIQGTAFLCLLWSFIQLNRRLKHTNYSAKLRLQVHDSLFSDTLPDEQVKYIQLVEQVATKEIMEYAPWLIVPLEMEHELSQIGGSWLDKEEVIFDAQVNNYVGVKTKQIYDENY